MTATPIVRSKEKRMEFGSPLTVARLLPRPRDGAKPGRLDTGSRLGEPGTSRRNHESLVPPRTGGGNKPSIQPSISDRLAELCAATYIPGHGRALSQDER